MTFYGIYDGHKMSYDSIKVWQYGYQINRLDLIVADKNKIVSFHWLGNQKDEISYSPDFPLCTSLYKMGVAWGDLNTLSMKETKLFLGSVYHR